MTAPPTARSDHERPRKGDLQPHSALPARQGARGGRRGGQAEGPAEHCAERQRPGGATAGNAARGAGVAGAAVVPAVAVRQ